MKTLLSLILSAALIAGCGGGTSSGNRSDTLGGDTARTVPARADTAKPKFSGTGWRLAAYKTGRGGVVVDDPRAARTTLLFTDSARCGGNTGCNRFGGTYRADSPAVGQVSFGPLMMTKMYCENVGMFETMYATALSGSLGYRLTRDSLVLRVSAPPNDSAIAELRFVPSKE